MIHSFLRLTCPSFSIFFLGQSGARGDHDDHDDDDDDGDDDYDDDDHGDDKRKRRREGSSTASSSTSGSVSIRTQLRSCFAYVSSSHLPPRRSSSCLWRNKKTFTQLGSSDSGPAEVEKEDKKKAKNKKAKNKTVRV